PWLTFKMTDDTELSVASDNLTINYEDGYLHLLSTSAEQSIPVDQIKSMKFTQSPAAVINVTDSISGNAYYYNLSGIMVGHFSSVEDARKALPSGMYIVKTDSKTFKASL
ncbi:MAG: hypothetical protein K2O47_03500, partial [Muribaculaceae bacterium]|nr:hypothetical protein [Muribaculaceae bacterium]